MTDIVYAVIDNHNKKKGKSYKIIYATKEVNEYMKFLTQKGLV